MNSMGVDYLSIRIDIDRAAETARQLYRLEGEITPLPGELDFNFRIKADSGSYILKISRPGAELAHIEFQNALLNHVADSDVGLDLPMPIADVEGRHVSEMKDGAGQTRKVRLLSWMKGRLWSDVNPVTSELLYSLGEEAGKMTRALQGFDHPEAHRRLDWDVANAEWTCGHLDLFPPAQQEIASHFQTRFKSFKEEYHALRKAVVHNDVNDNNIIVTRDMIAPKVSALIDFGDAVFTPIINDLAIAIAYAAMNKPDALGAALPVVAGYHSRFPLQEDELRCLYDLVAMRLVISVTKSAINKRKEPENEYLLISEKPAWEVLAKWMAVDGTLAHCSFRHACGFAPHPNEMGFAAWAKEQSPALQDLFPDLQFDSIQPVDMSVSSTWLGHESEYTDLRRFSRKVNALKQAHPGALIAGGYAEFRPFYCTAEYRREGNDGPEWRTAHLGVDFWVGPTTAVHALLDGIVVSLHHNPGDKQYGPTLILQHETDDGTPFFSLYGHLSTRDLTLLEEGQPVRKGDLLGHVGQAEENGNWPPHLHFEIMLDMLGYEHDFPGVCCPDELTVWSSICPDPNLLFGVGGLNPPAERKDEQLISHRKAHLGEGLSLMYDVPLRVARGSGAYLIEQTGRKYLDTVNNVANVGHEHPRVVAAGQRQMAVLNTNSRYLHGAISDFTEELLTTLPEELSVVHVVNSGSEANELALRMCQAASGQKDMIALEMGYHGNTGGCVDISSYKFDRAGGTGAPAHTHIVPLPDTYRGLHRSEDSGSLYAAYVAEQVEKIQSEGRNVAGFIFEAIVSCAGQVELPEDYLRLAFESVRHAGGLCVADEVQAGSGRVGSHFWSFQLHDVIPDIVTVGKPIGNGHPLAAVVCTRPVAAAFANGMEYFNTFGGNPVSCAIGTEVLRVVKEEGLQENALTVGQHLKSELQRLQGEFPVIGDVRGQGLFLGIELADGNREPLPEQAAHLASRMKTLGVLMSTDGKAGNVLKIKPPLVFSRPNADELLSGLRRILLEDFMQPTVADVD